jgi:hypothetical protein
LQPTIGHAFNAGMARPKKSKGPYSVEEWLRIILRGIRPEDRWQIFKAWRKWSLAGKLQREPTDQEIDGEILEWRKTQFYLTHAEGHFIDNLKFDFLPIYRKQNRIKKAREGGKALANKRIKKTI